MNEEENTNLSMNKTELLKIKKDEEEILKKQGTSAIYREFGIAGIVRLVKVEVSDWGVKVEAETIATLKKDPLPRNFKVDAAWEIFGSWVDEWHARYVNWDFIFDENRIKSFIEKNKDVLLWYENVP